jgi:uncharacterized protein involved in tolerance to divalent cations
MSVYVYINGRKGKGEIEGKAEHDLYTHTHTHIHTHTHKHTPQIHSYQAPCFVAAGLSGKPGCHRHNSWRASRERLPRG